MPDESGAYVVERTESMVQCECRIQPCRHAPDFYRCVNEWAVWDSDGNMVGVFDTRREARAHVAALTAPEAGS